MSEDFFDQLNIPKPDIILGAGGGMQAEQSAAIMTGYEKALLEWKPELCIVVGDVTSTMACAITAKKEWVKVAHVEGGIRSGDQKMPEEINRMVTDSISDYFFTTTETANNNLDSLGHGKEKIFFVGNTMIDSLLANLERLKKPAVYGSEALEETKYLVMTLHRPSNVDEEKNLKELLTAIDENVGERKVIFPMHPRTRKLFEKFMPKLENIITTEPLPYLEFIYLIKNSTGVITDSGGITEETTVMNIPCITLRDSTERPETVTIGTNEIVGTDPKNLVQYLDKLIQGNWKSGKIPALWDGNTSKRIVKKIIEL